MSVENLGRSGSSPDRPLRILLLVEGFNSLGGIPEIVDNLAAELTALGQEVAIGSTRDRHALTGDRARLPRCESLCTYLRIRPRKPLSVFHPERVFTEPLRARFGPLARLVAALRPDLVNSHLYAWDRYPTVAAACAWTAVPLVQSFHSFDYGRGALGDHALRVLSGARALVALSEAIRHFLQQLLPAAQPVQVISGGVDLDAMDAAAPFCRARPYVLCAGRFNLYQKAIDTLLRAFARVALRHAEVDLLLAGGGPDRDKIERLRDELSLTSRVELVGAKSREEMRALYKGALFFAMPSRHEEGLGLVFLEAMAAGKAVIGTRLGGVPELVANGKSGLLTPQDDVEALAGALDRLLSSPVEREKMGVNGRRAAAAYGWPQFAARYLTVYRSCLSELYTQR
jgi:glycosyltransferase involved in cell wall biosynthesis